MISPTDFYGLFAIVLCFLSVPIMVISDIIEEKRRDKFKKKQDWYIHQQNNKK